MNAVGVITGWLEHSGRQPSNQVIHYAYGRWGRRGREFMEPEIRAKFSIIDAKELEHWELPRRRLRKFAANTAVLV